MNPPAPSHLHTVLSRLNEIGAAINRCEAGDLSNLEDTLRLIVESATEVVPGSSAVIYTFDIQKSRFNIDSRVASERHDNSRPDDAPRADGMGALALRSKSRILSYEMPGSEINPARADQGAKAVACYPLMVADEMLGALYVYLHEARAFNELELLMLDNFVNLTAMTLSTVQRITLAQQEQTRKERELRRIWRAGMLISSHTRFSDTLDAILRMALELTEAKYGIFRLVDKRGTRLDTYAFAGEGQRPPATESLPIDEKSITGTVALRREPLVIADLFEEPWRQIYYPFDRAMTMRSELAVPLIGASGRLEGVLNLESPQVNAFSRQDRYLMQILATQAVAAIQEVRLLNMLQEITARVLTESLPVVQQILIEKAAELLNVPHCLLWLCEGEQLVILAASDPQMLNWRVEIADSITGGVIRGGEAALSSEASADLPGSANRYGPGWIVPLWMTGESTGLDQPIGAICILYPPDQAVEQAEWDRNVLNILGHYIALARQTAAHREAARIAQERHTVTEAFAAIGDIASNLLHQLNNKIGAIPVRIEGIQDKSAVALAADAYLRANLAEIETNATQAIQIVRENLFLLRPIRFSSVSVAEAIAAAMATARLPAEVRIVQQEIASLPKVHACPQRLPLVFLNLFDNAVRAMQGAGEIRVSGFALENKVEIRVKDSGPGIPAALHERIFEFNYSAGMAETHANLGFGLWWVKTLMARFGGLISVESDAQNGTTFVLELPLAEEGT